MQSKLLDRDTSPSPDKVDIEARRSQTVVKGFLETRQSVQIRQNEESYLSPLRNLDASDEKRRFTGFSRGQPSQNPLRASSQNHHAASRSQVETMMRASNQNPLDTDWHNYYSGGQLSGADLLQFYQRKFNMIQQHANMLTQ